MSELGFDPSDNSADTATPGGIGNVTCHAVLEFRRGDGANQTGDRYPGAYSDYTGFTPANTNQMLRDRNRWQPLLVNGTPQRWLLPQWAMVTPFALSSGAQFRDLALSQEPFVYPTAAYWKQAFDVLELSAQLGDTEKVIAEYWADGSGTVWPTSSATSRFAPSGETASNDIVGEGADTCATSPPELDTCAIRETDAGYSLKKIRDPSVPAKAFR
jgi:hypothetical protein